MTIPDYTTIYEVHKEAEKYKMVVNPDVSRVQKIIKKLETNENKYGKPYCPCLNNHNDDTVCPCKFMREHKACRCGLYIRKD